MSRGKWKRPRPDQLEVVLVPLNETDEAQLERWYESWRILEKLLARLDELETAEPIHMSETIQVTEGEPNEEFA